MADARRPVPRRILGVGIATLDVVNEVAAYPAEDDEIRALIQHRRRGGNVTNTLTLLRQFGHDCAWAGTLAEDAGSMEILRDLSRNGVGTRHCRRHGAGATPTSYVTLSRETGSRTIVHHRDLPEFTAADFARISLAGYDWVHFEGRNPAETASMLRDCAARRPELPVSLEVEKPRDGIEGLFAGPRVLIFSRSYVQAGGYADPRRFLEDQWSQVSAELLLLPWGKDGSYAQARGGRPVFAPAHDPGAVIDTLGAGDVFNAAVIDGLLAGAELSAILARGNRIAGHKCALAGLDGVVPSARAAGLL